MGSSRSSPRSSSMTGPSASVSSSVACRPSIRVPPSMRASWPPSRPSSGTCTERAAGWSPGSAPRRHEWRTTMPDPQQDLRATADSIRRDAEHLATLEEQKTVLDPADPRVLDISEKVERLAAGLQDKAVAERELVEEIQAEG